MVAAVNMNKDAKKTEFDPYHKWLGISPKEQPPTHYRLLGLQAFEGDRDVILAAVMRQSAHLKTYQLGQHAALTQKLLNEVSAAKVCLMDPQRKAAYDARLRKELEAKETPAAPQASSLPKAQPLAGDQGSGVTSASPVPAADPVVQPAIDPGLEGMFAEFQQTARPSGAKAKKRSPAPKRLEKPWPKWSINWPPRLPRNRWLVGGGAAVLAGLVLCGVLFKMHTPDGTLIVELSDPDATVQVFNTQGKLLIEQKAGAEKVEISVVPGEGKLRVMKNGFELLTREFSMVSGGRETINARIEPRRGTPIEPPTPPPAVAPFDEKKAKEHQAAWAKHLGVPVEMTNSIGMKLVLIPPGEFMMGDDADNSAKPAHEVKITRPFYLGKYEVTQEEWEKVMVGNPSQFKGANDPVTRVSWDDCQAFLKKLGKKCGATEDRYRLPTEAQWEYACRAGSTSAWCFGDSELELADYGWFEKNSEKKTHPVGQKKPNGWGLYDMHGNVRERCVDWYDKDYYKASPPSDPTGPSPGSDRTVSRGGSFVDVPGGCRSVFRGDEGRGNCDWHLGFRVSLVLADEPRGGTAEDAPGVVAAPPSPSAGETLPLDQFVDLLPRVDLERDRIVGGRIREGIAISNWSSWSARTLVPITINGDYDLRAELTRQQGEDSVGILAPVGDHYLILLLSCDHRNCWFNTDRSTLDHDKLLVNGQRYTVELRVRLSREKATVDASLDNATLMHWEGSEKDLQPDVRFQLPDSRAIALTVVNSVTTFHSVQLKMVSGKASWNDPTVTTAPGAAVGAADEAARFQHDREVAQWALSIKAGGEIELGSGKRVSFGDGPLPDVPFRIVGIDLAEKARDQDIAKVRGLDRLEWIRLDVIVISDEMLKLLSELPNLTRITTWCSRTISDEGVKSLGRLRKVRELCLMQASVTDAGLEGLREMENLEDLNVGLNPIEGRGLAHLAKLARLRTLGLGGTLINDAGLASLPALSNLRVLGLDGTRISDVGLEHLRKLPNLELLWLNNTAIKGPGLAHLAKLTRLNELPLDRTQIDDAGMANLSALSNLRVLGLEGTRVTDVGVERLRKLSNLENLRVGGTKVTGKGLFRLHEALPQCNFHADLPATEEYLTLMLQKEPDNVELHRQRAELLARHLHKWSEAAEDLAKVVELQPDDFRSWHKRTMLLVKLQQKDLFSEHLSKMLARFQNDSACRLGLIHDLTTFPTGKPELIQGGEVLADKLPASAETRLFAAFVRYRAGKCEEAVSLLSKVALTDPGDSGWRYRRTLVLAFHAMAKTKLNDREGAKELLSKARDAFKKAMNDDHGTDHGDSGEQWWDRLSAEALLAEAEGLIGGAK